MVFGWSARLLLALRHGLEVIERNCHCGTVPGEGLVGCDVSLLHGQSQSGPSRQIPQNRNLPGRAENAALDLLLDWGRQRMPELIEVRERPREKLKEVLKPVEAYWTETAPCGEKFTIEDKEPNCA